MDDNKIKEFLNLNRKSFFESMHIADDSTHLTSPDTSFWHQILESLLKRIKWEKHMVIAIITYWACVLSSFAQPSTLTVFSEEGDKFWVILNGAKQNELPQTKVVIPGQYEPFQKMRIIFEDEKIRPINQTVRSQGMDRNAMIIWIDVTYVIKKTSRGKYVIRMSGWKPSS